MFPGRIITGTFVKDFGSGITIDDDKGIRHFVTKDRVIGPVAGNDLFGPLP